MLAYHMHVSTMKEQEKKERSVKVLLLLYLSSLNRVVKPAKSQNKSCDVPETPRHMSHSLSCAA